jgi:anti-sigma-K factor RskA
MTDAPKDHRSQDVLAYKQGFLEGEELAEFEVHLRDCSACQATLERVSRFLPELQQALTTELRSSAEMWAAAQAEFAAKQAKRKVEKPRRSLVAVRLWLSAGLAAAAVSVAATIFFVARPLLMAAGPELAVHPGPDAGSSHGGVVAAPRRPGWDNVDGGVDGGEPR